jgi:hypothetical protein
MKQVKLDWKPRRNGRIYCAPACGGRCTWASYQKARAAAKELAKALGDEWKPEVIENLGWHWSVVNNRLSLDVSCHDGRYIAFLGGYYVGNGHSASSAIRNAAKLAKPARANWLGVMKCIEEYL